MNDAIDGQVSTFQKYLKQTRKSIMDISQKVEEVMMLMMILKTMMMILVTMMVIMMMMRTYSV